MRGSHHYVQSFEYWPDGSLKRKQLADGTWTGTYLYDPAGRLASIGNANAPSASEPAQYISSIAYNARGQTTAIAYGGGVSTSFTYNEARLPHPRAQPAERQDAAGPRLRPRPPGPHHRDLFA